jgi:ABC-type branched-subunit amino acid transport system ATPase component
VIDELSVLDNVAMSWEHSRFDGRGKRRDDVLAALAFVGLDVGPDAKVATLAARERRLLEVARAVVGRPRLILLDEPGAGLPDDETGHLAGVIQRIPEHCDALVILVDHDMGLVSACCQTTAVLDFGRLITSAPTVEALRDERVVNAYLGTEDVAA